MKRRRQESWEAFFDELVLFQKANGHCNVPTNSKHHARLGRWVSAQRYKRKIGEMTPDHIARLDRIGFVWSASDMAWETMFQALVEFKRRHGHCNVPEQWGEDQSLASWVQRQRFRRRRDALSKERIDRLDDLGFSWAIYKCEDEEVPPKPKEADETVGAAPVRQRLYALGNGVYVQHNGIDAIPPKLEEFVKAHHGEFPPYIPLPAEPTEFRLGDGMPRRKTVTWSGVGALPEEVLTYVRRNGTLPPHDW